MKLTVLLLVLGVSSVYSQIVFTDCLSGWIKYNENCYKFVNYPRQKVDGASTFCQENGAMLLSVNDIGEHSFISNWLETSDGSRDRWMTSGLVTTVPQGVTWLGDGSSSTSLSFWDSSVNVYRLNDGDNIIYNFTGVEYRWAITDGLESSFICEIGLQDIYKILDDPRDFDYGLPFENPELAPRGPRFVVEPVETTILSKTSAAYLDCLADGSPKPTYTWWKGDDMEAMVQVPTGPGHRFTTTGGQLTIDTPEDKDEGTYVCNATNQFGIILSSPVALSFGTLGDFANVATADVYGQLSDGAVISCPTITAKPGLSYQWYKLGDDMKVSFIRPEMQSHTFISAANTGKLYFSELASSDESMYFCMVTLTSRGGTGNYIGSDREEVRTSLGFKLHVDKGVSSNFQPVIQDNFPMEFPKNPKRGQNVEIECFSYGTAPLIYRWYRLGREMPRTATFSESRRTLYIANAQLEDSGTYRCRVDGQRTNLFDEKDFLLNILSEPYFSYPLQDQHVDVGDRLTWHCEARGKPVPKYQWYKNGVPAQNSTGVSISGNTMFIQSLEMERDNGMYQCRAENLYGITFSSAQIRVLEFAPSFDKHPVDSSLSAAVGGNVTIVCNPEAAPAPNYQWLRNGNDLGLTLGGAPSNGNQMLLNGNLFIENIDNNHQGTYTCKVTNSQGEASSSGTLQVFASIVISQRPTNAEERVNETASLICQASAPANIDVVYVWKFNDYIIDFDHRIEYKMGTGTRSGYLFINGVQYKNEGRYTCQVTTGMDSASASAYLTVRGPPGEPSGVIVGDNIGQDVTAVLPNDKFVRLYWSEGLDHGAAILAYTVEFRTNFDMTWRVHPDANQVSTYSLQSNEYPDKRTILLKNLKPNAGHQFRVRALNSYGVGEPSLPTIYIQVEGTAPIVAPRGVGGGGGKVGDLTITWQPLAKEDYNGKTLTYMVYWRAKSNTVADQTRWDEMEVTPEEACEMETDLEEGLVEVCSYVKLVGADLYYMPYEVRVQGKNEYGTGVLSGIQTIMSAEEMPTATPRNVYSISYNATALQVFWTPVVNTREQMRGRLTGYRINYWDRDLEEEEQARFNIIAVPPGADNVDGGLIIGLVPGHWYVVNVQSISSAGYGPKGEDYPQETANYAPGLYPTEVHVYSIEGIGVRVNFRGISTKVAEEPLMGYKLQYWASGDNIRQAQEKDVGRANYGTITNLTESVLYQLRIYGYSRGGQGKRSSPSIYFTIGGGQVIFNPESTEVMAGGPNLQCSLLTLLTSLLVAAAMRHLHHPHH